jgi:fructose-1,6-bisphosphatase I
MRAARRAPPQQQQRHLQQQQHLSRHRGLVSASARAAATTNANAPATLTPPSRCSAPRQRPQRHNQSATTITTAMATPTAAAAAAPATTAAPAATTSNQQQQPASPPSTSAAWARRHCAPSHRDSLPALLAAIEAGCRRISARVQRAGIDNMYGYSSGSNASGDAQKKLDVLSDEIFAAALAEAGGGRCDGSGGLVRCYASEEADEPVVLSAAEGRYVVVFDPLDGSRNVDVAIPTGTIFGVYESLAWRSRRDEERGSGGGGSGGGGGGSGGGGGGGGNPYGPEHALADVLQPGVRQLAAGYCLYSSAVVLALAVRTEDPLLRELEEDGDGDDAQTPSDAQTPKIPSAAAAFALDTLTGDFVATHDPLACPTRGQIYSLNDARFDDWPAGLQRYICDVRAGKGATQRQYSARYVCSLVADLHRTLLQGGWCGNPRSHLRLLYEGNPLAFLTEAAGGSASDGKRRVLGIMPRETHERLPLFLGSSEDVAELESYGDVQQTGAKKYSV